MDGFYPDPVLVWLVPEGEPRRRFLRGLFHASFEDSLQTGELRIAEDDDGVCGVAVWYPPGRARHPHGRAMDDALAVLDVAALDRLATLGQATSRHAPADPHFYLWLMAVAPDRRGAGIGGSLLAAVLEICDKRQTLAYLEATRPENRRLYERHGFLAIGEVPLPEGPTKTPMVRTPRS